jgi:hypothetical protein
VAVPRAIGGASTSAAASTGSSTGSAAGGGKADPLLDKIGAYLLEEFNLSKNDAADLEAMVASLGTMHKKGAFDTMAPMRLARMVKGIDLGSVLGMGGKGDRTQVKGLAASADSGAMAAMEKQNHELRAQLDQVMERLSKLESAPAPDVPPDTPAAGGKKTRK